MESLTLATREEELHRAVRKNDMSALEYLVNDGVSINCIYYGTTPLAVAVSLGQAEMSQWIVNHGGDVEAKDVHLTSVFEEVVHHKQFKLIQALSQHGCDINLLLRGGNTALSLAAETGNRSMVDALIQAKCDLNSRNSNGETAVYVASKSGKAAMVQILVKAGADMNVTCGRSKDTPLMAAISHEHWDVTRLLIKMSCDVNLQDDDGWTALRHAVSNSNEDLVVLLLKANADTTLEDSEGKTVLDEARENDDLDLIDILTSSR